MSETTLLRSSAIVRTATVGAEKPPQVNTGALPLVQVKMTPGGPQVKEGQQRPVQILPPRNAKGAVQTGGLPMVQVKMTQNGPQLDDGQNRDVVIKDNRQAVAAGGLPMVQVKMTQGGPQVQTVPNVQGGPPRIPGAAPALSAPRGAAPQPRKVVLNQQRVARIAAPKEVPPDLSADQLLLCRHTVDKYLGELRGAEVSADEASALVDNIKLAEETVSAIDIKIAALTEQAAEPSSPVAEQAAVEVAETFVTDPAARTAGGFVMQGASGQPVRRPVSNGFVMKRPGGRGNMAPRRVVRADGTALPPVIVKMDGQRAVVQNHAEIAAAAAAEFAALIQPQTPAPAAPEAPVAVPEAAAPEAPAPAQG